MHEKQLHTLRCKPGKGAADPRPESLLQRIVTDPVFEQIAQHVERIGVSHL